MANNPTDLSVIKNEIERIRHHQDLQKKANDENSRILIEIKNTLVGSDMNGNKGLVDEVKNVKNKVDDLENFHQEIDIYVKQGKWIIGFLTTAIIGILVKLFTK